MRLSWNEVRARAAKVADDWQDAAYEKGIMTTGSCSRRVADRLPGGPPPGGVYAKRERESWKLLILAWMHI